MAHAMTPVSLEQSILDYEFIETQEHSEFVRYFYETPDGNVVGVEIIRDSSPAGAWTTGQYRVMPAPQTSPPTDLLLEVMKRLRDPVIKVPFAEQKVKQESFTDTQNGYFTHLISIMWQVLAAGLLWWIVVRTSEPLSRRKGLHYLGLLAVLVLFNSTLVPVLDRPFFSDDQTQKTFEINNFI